VRVLNGRDLHVPSNLMADRIALFRGPESPFLKLVALIGSAYVGETTITLFQHRIAKLDPERRHFISKMIWSHDQDEKRHIRFDHFVFGTLLPSLTLEERKRFGEILTAQTTMALALGARLDAIIGETFGVEYVEGNKARALQYGLLRSWGGKLFASEQVRFADDVIDEEERRLVSEFAGVDRIHPESAASWRAS
jgi:hypothetical protein